MYISDGIKYLLDFNRAGAGDRVYPWNKPLRIRYKSDQEERTIYLFVRFHHKYGIRASDNKKVYEKLKQILKEKH